MPPKTWGFLCLIVFSLFVFYLQTQISRLEDSFRELGNSVFYFHYLFIVVSAIDCQIIFTLHTCYFLFYNKLHILKTYLMMFCNFVSELSNARARNREFPTLNSNRHTVSNNDDNSNGLVVIYNRVPKTGSTSFVGVAYDLCKKNSYKVLHINITANMHVMSLNNQYRFAQNVTNWNSMKPALYHGHMAFLNFERYVIIIIDNDYYIFCYKNH